MAYRIPKKANRHQKPPCGTTLNMSDPLVRGIKAAYLLNEGAGSKVINYAHAVNGVVATPTTSWGRGYGGSSYKGNGSNTYVTLGNSSTNPWLNIPGEMTIVSMINLTNTSSLGSICTDGNSGYQWIFEANRQAGKISIGWTSNLWVYSTATLVANTWYTVGMTRSLSGSTYTASTWINGLFDNSGTTTTVPSSQQGSWIGRLSSGTQHFNGTIEYVYIWNRVLSSTEILTIHEHPYRLFTPNSRRKSFGIGTLLSIGGVALGGTSTNTEFYNSIVVTGGSLNSGTSTIGINFKNIDAVGGGTSGGASNNFKSIDYTATGGSLCGGIAELDSNDTIAEIASGGATSGGLSTLFKISDSISLPGILIGSTAVDSFNYNIGTFGGVALEGITSNTISVIKTSQGGCTLGGNSDITHQVARNASGGATLGGNTSPQTTYQLLRATNGIIINGTSQVIANTSTSIGGRAWMSGTSDVDGPTLESLMPKFGTIIAEVVVNQPVGETVSLNLKKKTLERMVPGRYPVNRTNQSITIYTKD